MTNMHTSASADPRPVSNLVTCRVWRANSLSFEFVSVLLAATSTRCRSVRSALLASRARTKRDTLVAEVCVMCSVKSVKRGLFVWQKRPVHVAKEACSCGKRGLLGLAYLKSPEIPAE